MDYIYDIESWPNVFLLTAKEFQQQQRWFFEISWRRNDYEALVNFLRYLQANNARMVGFNNMHFDWPVVNYMLVEQCDDPEEINGVVRKIIFSDDNGHVIYRPFVEQIDLFKIHHFDNRAKATSLKMLEFNMRMDNIEELPFAPGTWLETDEDIVVAKTYNWHDVKATEQFMIESADEIQFREYLTREYRRNVMNHNDTKIGKSWIIDELEKRGVPCYEESWTATGFNGEGYNERVPRQTHRMHMPLNEVILPYISFRHPEFQRTHAWMMQQTVTDTYQAFKDVNCTINGFRFDFGTGGIHGSIESAIVKSNDEWVILDLDVKSYYPSLAICNRLYPEHLSEAWCDVLEEMFKMRSQYEKSSPESKALKLGLNGSYGDAGSPFSPFYDPMYLLRITINGQLLLCVLAEYLFDVPDLQLIQINTDGITVRIKREHQWLVQQIADWWQGYTKGLQLELVEYNRMFIRDVNNYIAEAADGELKRKGAYEHIHPKKRNPVGWHQNLSALVVPKAAEAALVHGADIEQFIHGHQDVHDFMLRAKVNRNSQLYWGDDPVQSISRYYICDYGKPLRKESPPPEGYQVGQWKRANSVPDGVYAQVRRELQAWVDDAESRGYEVDMCGVDLDSTGLPWDERINTKNRSKYGNRVQQFHGGWLVMVCNRLAEGADYRHTVNEQWYIEEAKKLVDPLVNNVIG